MTTYDFKSDAAADLKCIVQGDKWRFSVLSEKVIRMEYSESGEFVDRKTQIVLNRRFPVPDFTVTDKGDSLQISTRYLLLTYDKKPFSSEGLQIQMMGNPWLFKTSSWFYGDEELLSRDNLGGSATTLDNAVGDTYYVDKGDESKPWGEPGEKIPISQERQRRLLEDQIEEITDGIAEVKENNGERFTIKQLEKTKKSLEARLKKLLDSPKDDVVTFEQLGVDRMFVDESDNYKNLFLYTKMRNVAGLSTTDAQKSSDMFMKCRYMDEKTGGRGNIFATGTPISNSMTELYTIQRYLQYDRLQELGMGHFDCWASRFGETVSALELAPEGTGYRMRTRFAKFFNLPELMNLFKEVADIKTADQLNLPTPEVEYHTYASKPTEIQQEMVQSLSERATRVHSGSVDPTVDNMLKITNEGRMLALDERIIDPTLPDNPNSKVNKCIKNVLEIYKATEDKNSTQLIFCDKSVPNKKEPNKFNVYDDIRKKLVEAGVPREEIAFVQEAKDDEAKEQLFAKVRAGKVRVLLGGTDNLGVGTNVQDKLIATHDLDVPWRPADLEQRMGRIVRRGNENDKVKVFRYVTKGTFDAYMWQLIENKQRFISQIMSSKIPTREAEDCDEIVLNAAEIKALAAGDPLIKEKMDVDNAYNRLKIDKGNYLKNRELMSKQVKVDLPNRIAQSESHLEAQLKNKETWQNLKKLSYARWFYIYDLFRNNIYHKDIASLLSSSAMFNIVPCSLYFFNTK